MGEGLDAQKIINHINLMHSHVQEHGTDVFRELVKTNPKKAVEQLSDYIEKVLGLGDGIFRGIMCGGPHPSVTAPMLDAIGSVYPCLERKLREQALRNCLNFLNNQEYHVSQENVSYINEPWLVGDILANRGLYNCGFNSYSDRIKTIDNWFQFKDEFVDDGKFDVNSIFWLSYAVSFTKYCPQNIRDGFAKEYPELVDRTKDAIAGYIHRLGLSADTSFEKPMPYGASIVDSLERFDPSWHSEIRKKIAEKKFIILDETLQKIKEYREYKAREAAKERGEF
jgi:hypothetical protein